MLSLLLQLEERDSVVVVTHSTLWSLPSLLPHGIDYPLLAHGRGGRQETYQAEQTSICTCRIGCYLLGSFLYITCYNCWAKGYVTARLIAHLMSLSRWSLGWTVFPRKLPTRIGGMLSCYQMYTYHHTIKCISGYVLRARNFCGVRICVLLSSCDYVIGSKQRTLPTTQQQSQESSEESQTERRASGSSATYERQWETTRVMQRTMSYDNGRHIYVMQLSVCKIWRARNTIVILRYISTTERENTEHSTCMHTNTTQDSNAR